MDLFSRLKDKKILLVDDDEWIRDSLTLYFSNEGCHMLAVETAEEGMELSLYITNRDLSQALWKIKLY
jgi:DNA-binding response OmpR family regulator